MYNLLVTAAQGAWDLPAYEFDRTRFLEYTADSVKARFAKLDAQAQEELKSLPTLFTYEGDDEPVRVGYIRRIRERGRSVLVEYEFDENVPAFDFSSLKPLEVKLDIQGWEMSRTHWAVKDEDLFELLASVGLVDASYVGEGRPTGRVEEMRFRVALSFPGEKREYVAAVATEVKKRLGRDAIFYDKDFTAQLARPNLDTLLQRIYLSNSDLVVVFLCAEYERKEWCGLEWRAIRNIIKNKNDHAIMFMRFDRADVSGAFSIDGYVDLDEYTPLEAARMIVERVRLNDLPAAAG
ncbi:TIR domain-containing protein [Burkholderia pseudomallei]|uniref:TIR domain-containing protein n=1 Tax=Burkholderia pseudomallei TaxID=28450 RepID=UPI002DBD01D6|nr:TIR domain-containing protein [Burkholderia pseudomallei]MEB5485015.1 TIR domain-containing protein [Burkholderia pseudomallei]MEB5491794.1 TIR domain-containing protein [Burkholderia pseudomallei]MEB5498564.1 TIR domain-containing protein [Burkholderia pseudomallei]MEB5503768.1 TIR domain-containing protein [Burkholderia pseudomallei]MEB5511501.1 TIR domain-containing protein [Burkholderia pseudomallei]